VRQIVDFENKYDDADADGERAEWSDRTTTNERGRRLERVHRGDVA